MAWCSTRQRPRHPCEGVPMSFRRTPSQELLVSLAIAAALALATSCRYARKGEQEPVASSGGLPTLYGDASAAVSGGPGVGGAGPAVGPAAGGPQDASVATPPAGELPAPPPPPPPPPAPTSTAVLTFRNDTFRTGAQLLERQLDVAKVRARGMVLKF